MTAKSDYLEQKVLDHCLGITSFTMPANTYLAAYTTATNENGTGTEVSGNNYARKQITPGSHWASGAQVGGAFERASNTTHTFNQATPSGWGNIQDASIMDASTSGNMLYHGPLLVTVPVNALDTLHFPSGGLKVAES